MRELSLNVLDIAQNSVSAGASLIEIFLAADTRADCMSIEIKDNGRGMSEDFLKRITDPFTTTRTTRKVGMGIPLFKYSAESAGGSFSIRSQKGAGTAVKASYKISHIDRMPLGDMESTLTTLISMSPDIDFVFKADIDGTEAALDTREMREVLGDEAELNNPEILDFIKNYIKENISVLYGGIL